MDKKTAIIAGLGFELTGLILGGLYIGNEVDKVYQLGGLGVGSGAFIGLLAWSLHVALVMKKQDSK